METSKTNSAHIRHFLPWANFGLLLVLVPLVAMNSCSKTETVVVGDTASSAVVGEDVKEALQNAEELLEADDFSGAFDMLLVASRLAPSDPYLFDLVVRFVRQADSSKSEDAIAMAEDLLDRGDSLVYFQRTQNVRDARNRLTELREQFISSEPAFEPPTPLDGVMAFMSVAEDASKPTSVRTGAAGRARSLLDDLQLQIAIGEQPETEQLAQKSLEEMYNRIDAVEQQCIESLFVEKNDTQNRRVASGCIASDRASQFLHEQIRSRSWASTRRDGRFRLRSASRAIAIC